MKVCGKKDIHVPGCDDCSELEERVEAVEECCDDAHDEIDTLNTDKADKDYVDDSIETVNQTIVDVADTLGERIDNIITSSEPSVTTLWEGVMESIGDSANLSEDVNDFDYLDIYYRTSADESEGYYNTVRIPADQFANYTITVGGTLSPLGESPNLSQYLTQLSFVDDTATIDNIREWSWNGSQSSDASDDPQAETGVTIYRIDGVKETGGNAEIADARIGVDGTVYPSLGDAIRGQIQDTRDMIPQLVKTVQGNPIVLDDAFGEVKNLTVELLPIQEGSGTPSPQNVRPITGHGRVTAGVTGVNQWDEQWEVGTINSATGENDDTIGYLIRSKNYIPITDDKTYYCYCGIYGTAEQPCGTRFYDANKNYIGRLNADGQQIYWNTPAGATQACNPPRGARYMRFVTRADYGTTYNNDISINLPSTDTSYHAYHGQSKTVTLPHTVYGAGVGVTSGEGAETRKTVDISTLNWSYWQQSGTQNTFYVNLTDKAVGKKNMITSIYEVLPTGGYGELANGQIVGTDANNYVYLVDNRYNNVTDFKNGVAGVQLCYELATPTDLQTTPTDITLYNGDNVISSDGDMDLSYVQDMAIVIRKIENQL